MNLPSVHDLNVSGKTVLLRTNYDVPLIRQKGKMAREQERWEVEDATRIEESVETIELLLKNGAEKIIIISHLGRPGGKTADEYSLQPVKIYLEGLLKKEVGLYSGPPEPSSYRAIKLPGNQATGQSRGNIVMLENLRFWTGEEENDDSFAKDLAALADVYVNDAFAGSHRKHASIVGVTKYLPSVFGLDMLEEVDTLSRLRENPKRPVVLLLGGAKRSKIEAAKKLVGWADWILVGGRLVEYDGLPDLFDHPKIEGNLIKSGQDITIETAEKFAAIIAKAGTVVWAGPMGNFYEEGAEAGTRTVGEAVAKSKAFSVVGGGDTETALTRFGLVDKIKYVSSGGGAMLEFLADGSLPGIEAIIKKDNKMKR